jgi:pimeloyl-ACP methyl ester carboxylesterase
MASRLIRSIRTNVLDIAYEEAGPAGGETIVLLHGWPDSVRTWDAVVPALVGAGYRCVMPYLRGCGPTRFLERSTRRSGQATALAQDLKDFVDALQVTQFVLVGHDWGAFAAYLFAANWPEQVQRLIVLSVGYGINNPNRLPALPQAQAFWYQWFFQTQQAPLALEQDRRSFCQFIWQEWMARGHFDQQQFEATVSAWDNPDWVAVTLHYYRHRWGNGLGDPQYDALEVSRLLPPRIRVPTRLIHGAEDACILPATTEGKEELFVAGYERRLLPGVGHFPQREQPAAVIAAILE